jgi:hypothetical protein
MITGGIATRGRPPRAGPPPCRSNNGILDVTLEPRRMPDAIDADRMRLLPCEPRVCSADAGQLAAAGNRALREAA